MSTAFAVAIAVAFVRLGAVLATLEAPPRFRAPGITLPPGVGIGRPVFRAHQVCASLALLKAIGLVTGADRADDRLTRHHPTSPGGRHAPY